MIIVYILILIIWLASGFSIYNIWGRNITSVKDMFDLRQVLVKKDPLREGDINFPYKSDLTCNFKDSQDSVYTFGGVKVSPFKFVPCTECNKYVYKSDENCLHFMYDKSLNEPVNSMKPETGVCTVEVSEKDKKCPF